MSSDTKWEIATVWVVATLLAGLFAAQLSAGFQGVNTRLDDLNTSLSSRMDRLGNRLDSVDERLRGVEIAVGKVHQRLLTIERVVLPGGEQP